MTSDSRNSEIKQQLSALVDGELERDQARFLIRRVGEDSDLSGCWQRYHIVGECLRGHGVAPVRADFVARVSMAIEGDAVPRRALAGEALKWAGGFAVAASVALVALMAMRPDAAIENAAPDVATIAATAPPAQVAPSPLREQDLRPSLGVDTATVAAESNDSPYGPYAVSVRIDPRIDSYLIRHNEATGTQGQAFVPYVSLVTPLRERAPAPQASR